MNFQHTSTILAYQNMKATTTHNIINMRMKTRITQIRITHNIINMRMKTTITHNVINIRNINTTMHT